MNPAFQELRDGFMERHADVFEDTEENKLQYMGIFKDWTATIESYITRSLTAAIPGFEMMKFLRTLASVPPAFLFAAVAAVAATAASLDPSWRPRPRLGLQPGLGARRTVPPLPRPAPPCPALQFPAKLCP